MEQSRCHSARAPVAAPEGGRAPRKQRRVRAPGLQGSALFALVTFFNTLGWRFVVNYERASIVFSRGATNAVPQARVERAARTEPADGNWR